MITKEKISSGLKERLVTLEVDPNMGAGTVCRIGDWWFYFGGETAEEMNPDEFLKCVPEDDIVDEIFEALESFRQDEECADEYEYYDAILTYRNGYSG